MKLLKVLVAGVALLASMFVPAQAGNPNCTEVAGDYIVSFPRGANVGNEMKAAAGRQIETKFTYGFALNGFAATLTAEQVCAFKKRPGASVEKDGEAFASGKPVPSATTDWYSWGLDRINQKSFLLDNTITRDTINGSGVRAFIIDSGIYSAHSQFGGRVQTNFFTAISDGRGTEDCNGHGTHVAGTVGGLNSGVTNNVTLFPVRVLNCRGSGSWSGIIKGIDKVIEFVKQNPGPAVANMSLGGGKNDSVNTAVMNLVNSKVIAVVAAGNDSANACNYSPASAPEAITVGASAYNSTTKTEFVASYSNFGDCVDVFAPGSNIKSSWIGSIGASNTISGTSMASPHVAGIVARQLQKDPSYSWNKFETDFDSSPSKIANTSINLACLIDSCS